MRTFYNLTYRLLLSIAIAGVWSPISAQTATTPLALHAPVEEKNFYLLALLASDREIRSVLAADQQLSEIAAERQRFIGLALRGCKSDSTCLLKSLLWTDEEIRAASLALSRGYRSSPALRAAIERQLRPSGAYILYDHEDKAALLMSAWELCAHGLNGIISVYGMGTKSRYPSIDSMSIDAKSADFAREVTGLVSPLPKESSPPELFFEPTLHVALELLALNHRDEAGRLEPMEKGVNRAAVEAVSTMTWSRYPFSVIVVPGAGPTDPETPLSAAGRQRVALAVQEYRDGKAPFILLSGGFVHPAQTPFSEALEMKKVLLHDFNVPESAILADPHARHTTTNIRNAVREIDRYHIPMDKPALVVSDAAQTGYIAGQFFADRCLKELGYLPYRLLKRESDTSLSFLPTPESMQQDPIDPLDP